MLVTVKVHTKEIPWGGKPFAREINDLHPVAEAPQAGASCGKKKEGKKNTVH